MSGQGTPIPNFDDDVNPDRWVNPVPPPDLEGEPPHDLHLVDGPDANPFVDRILAALLTTDKVKDLPPPNPLVDGYLNLNSVAELYGPSGVGKSFLATDLALHVSRGAWWQGREVKGGTVLYVVAEGATGTGVRVDAWERHNNMAREVHAIQWLPWAVNIFDATWAAALAEVVGQLRPSLIVLDTLARSIVGADENSARDMGVVVAHLDRLKDASGACVLIVHHTGKDASAGGRGSSALKGAMDTELELTGDGDRLTLRTTKQKDGPALPPLHLAMVAVEAAGSMAITTPRRSDPTHLPAGVTETLDALKSIDVPGGVPSSAWKASANTSDRQYYRHRSGLIEQGLVVNIGTDSTPRYRPASAVEGGAT